MILRNLIAAAAVVGAVFSAAAYRADTIMVPSKHLEKPMRVTVLVPEAAAEHRDLPTVYLLNGYGGDYRSWTHIRPDLGHYADHYGMVMVLPSGRNSWYWNSYTNPKMQMESFFVEDLVPYINAHYPVTDNPRKRAITGLSMGGQGGLYLGTRHPDIWGNIGSTSGGVDIRPFPTRWSMAENLGPYAENKERWEETTVVNLVPQMVENKNQNIIFDCGSEDFFAPVNRDLHQRLLDAKRPHDYISRPGTHNMTYWANSILYQLLFFHENFKKAQK